MEIRWYNKDAAESSSSSAWYFLSVVSDPLLHFQVSYTVRASWKVLCYIRTRYYFPLFWKQKFAGHSPASVCRLNAKEWSPLCSTHLLPCTFLYPELPALQFGNHFLLKSCSPRLLWKVLGSTASCRQQANQSVKSIYLTSACR